MPGRPWSQATPAVPPPSRRQRPKTVSSLEQAAVRLLHDVGDVLAVLTRRSPADFRPLPSASHTCAAPLQRALAADADPLPASLLVELAPLLEPRLQRLAPRLRRRLGRTRTLQPIGRIREADPGCQRRNARRPGRTMLEKAGPRQELWGVRRIPRFDTTENRVLLAACRQFSKDIHATLEPLPMAARRGEGRAAILRGLRRAAEVVAGRPELEGIGRPRPGERPSNALLGDADYRAAWRAWRLLRAEEARFGEDWAALDQAWLELLALATWAALDARDDLEPVAGWMHVHHRRDDGRRLHTGGPRCWVGPTEAGLRAVQVRVSGSGVVLEVRDAAGGRAILPVGGLLRVVEREDGTELVADRQVASASASAALESLEPGRPVSVPSVPHSEGCDALSLLDSSVYGSRGGRVEVLDACAAAELAVPDEAPLTVLGRPASWRPDALGPAAMWWEQPQLVGRFVSRLRGVDEPAVVVPDAFDDLSQQRLRREAGPCWLIPAPVAAALALRRDPPPDGPEVWLTVVRTAASLDIAMLERWADPDQPDAAVWIRSAPRHDSRGGRHDRVAGAAQGAAVRADAGEPPVVLGDAGPEPVALPPTAAIDRSRISAVQRRWKGDVPTRLLLVGLSDIEAEGIQTDTGLPATRLSSAALAQGAAVFLERHGAGLPTWKDRLPGVDLLVKRGRRRDPLTLIEPDRLVAPGDTVQHDPPERFTLAPATRLIRFPMTIDGAESPADLCIDGPPLPLPRKVEVRVRLSYVHGRQGLTAWLVPVGAAPFSRIPFDLVAADGGDAADTEGPTLPDALTPPRAPYPDELERLHGAFGAVLAWREGVDPKTWKGARSQAGSFGGDLERVLKDLRGEAETALHGTTDEAMPGDLRAWLCSEVLPWLAWLGGHAFDPVEAAAESGKKNKRRRRSKGGGAAPSGHAPQLTRNEQAALVRVRAALRLPVEGDQLYEEVLRGHGPVPEAEWRRMLGGLCGPSPEGAWTVLTESPVSRPVDEAALAGGVVTALFGNPGLVHSMSEAHAAGLLRRFAGAVDAIARSGGDEAIRRKRDVYLLLRGIETMLQVRHRDLLPPAAPAVQDVRAQLKAAGELLPSKVLEFAEHTNTHREDEQLARTLDALSGRYGDVAALE